MADVLPFPSLFESVRSEPMPPPDAEARRQALDVLRSFIVEAPAGSGKTGLLIQRFLKLLNDPAVTAPEQVLAITFTIKATAEMRDRVLAHLEGASSDSVASLSPGSSEFDRETRALALAVLERDRQLDWSLLQHPERINIRTIDSVCAEIARTLPVLSGSGGRLSPVHDAAPLHREAARRTLLLLGGGDPAFENDLRNLLLHRDGNLADCESLIADMLSLRDQWGELVPIAQHELDDAFLDSVVLPRLQQALEQALCDELGQLEQTFPSFVLAELTALAAEVAGLDGYAGKPSPMAIFAGRSEPPEATAADLDHWLALIHMVLTRTTSGWRKQFNANVVGFALDRNQKARLAALIDQISHREDLREALLRVSALPPAQYPAEQWTVAKSLFRVLSRALVQLQFIFAERNQCDFTELSLLARHALTADSGAEDLAAALGARLQHLLVDEMQDTSTSQYDLLRLLTASWDGHSQTVFLVGDPRQSIYLFRQARVERFIHALRTQQLGDLPLTRLRLTANFRSQREVVRQFNRDFSRIFPAASIREALPYSDAEAVLPPSPHASGVAWHADSLPYVERSAAEPTVPTAAQQQQRRRREHAQEILHLTREWLSKPLPEDRRTIRDELGKEIPEPWRIAILVRSRNHLTEIVAALRQQAGPGTIPFRATEIEALNERQEVLDLTALTRALLHPADRVAALAILRAPWCGLSLADLHTLTGKDDPSLKHHSLQRLMDERGHLLPDDAGQRLARIWSVLQAAVAKRGRLTTAQLVERAWRSLGGDRWLDSTQLTNARRFLQLLDEVEADLGGSSRIDPLLLEQRLQRLYAEPATIGVGTAYVELLTIHNAKGLEWDVVVIPSLERRPAIDLPRLLTWSAIESPSSAAPFDRDAAHIMLAPIAGKGEESHALTRWLKKLQQARETAEHKRLFYVACTRAREELHLFAAPQFTSNSNLNPHPGSLLKAAWAAAESRFTAAAEDASSLDIAASHTPNGLVVSRDSRLRQKDLSGVPHEIHVAAHPALQRVPITFDPAARFAAARMQKLPYAEDGGAPGSIEPQFSRPQGSFAARAFGNVVHAALEVVARCIAEGQTPAKLIAELPAWMPRIAALLRADGLPRSTVEPLARDARAALENVLRDPDGLWLLAPHSGAANEFALTAWAARGQIAGEDLLEPASVRADRIFHAGPQPRAPGEDFLWIIDYKTATHSPTGLDDFLAAQRAAYAPQLETYARILAPAQSKSATDVRLALYFPALPRLVWWKVGLIPQS